MAPFQMDRMAGMTPMILLRLSSRTLNPTSGKRGANPRRILGQDSRIALWLSVPLSTIPTMTGRMWVEAWSPEYGTSYGIDAPDPDAPGGAGAQAEPAEAVPWAPVNPGVGVLPPLAFLDGVSRVDARVFLESDGELVAGPSL